MKKTEQLLTIEETVTVLTTKLGQPVAWIGWLADLRRPRDDVGPTLYGLQLHPACTHPDDSRRPVYSASAIKKFVEEVKLANPTLKFKPIMVCEYERLPDEDTQRKTWRFIRAVITKIAPSPSLAAPTVRAIA